MCHRAFLPTVTQNLSFAHLRELSLAGFCATEETTQRIIREHPALLALSLRYIRLTSGSWEPILIMLSQAPSLVRLYLSYFLSSGNNWFISLEPANAGLDPPDPTDVHCRFPGVGEITRVFRRDELKNGLQCRPIPWSSGMASLKGWRWML